MWRVFLGEEDTVRGIERIRGFMDMKSTPLHLYRPTDDESRPASLPALPRRLRGVLFDMGNVLYDDTVWRRWLLRLLTQLGLQTNYCSFFHIWDRDHLDAVHRGQQSFCAAFESFLASVGMSRGQIEEVQAACQARRRLIEDSLRPLPGVRSTLARIVQSKLTMAAICNSELPAAALRERIERFGMGHWFSAVVSSIDLGHAMPDPECYAAALGEMGLPAEEVAFVGHDAAELAGASAAGMFTVAFNFPSDARADVYLSRLEELLAVLAAASPPLAAAG
jgi:FMN phosphatase YigB (HAD superfamily)